MLAASVSTAEEAPVSAPPHALMISARNVEVARRRIRALVNIVSLNGPRGRELSRDYILWRTEATSRFYWPYPRCARSAPGCAECGNEFGDDREMLVS